MSSYATIADMRARFAEDELIQLTDDALTGAVDEGQVTRALSQADDDIDAYVGRFFKRIDATSPVPGILVNIACDVARYYLFRHGVPTEQAVERWKSAMKKLELIAAGKIVLDQGEEQFPARDGQVLVFGEEQMFSRSSMRGL